MIQYPHDDPLVVILNIANYDISHVLVDNGSSIDVLFYDTLLKMNIPLAQLKGRYGPLSRLSRKLVFIIETIMLPVIVGQVLW